MTQSMTEISRIMGARLDAKRFYNSFWRDGEMVILVIMGRNPSFWDGLRCFSDIFEIFPWNLV